MLIRDNFARMDSPVSLENLSLTSSDLEDRFDKTLEDFEESREDMGNQVWFVCSRCRREIGEEEYRYKFLTCENVDLCSACFQKSTIASINEMIESKKKDANNINNIKTQQHAVLRVTERCKLFGRKFDEDEIDDMNLEKLNVEFGKEVHTAFTCKSCNTSDIRGIRFTCEKDECRAQDGGFGNWCYSCFRSHSHSHIMIAMGATSLEINPTSVTKKSKIFDSQNQQKYAEWWMGKLETSDGENSLVTLKILKFTNRFGDKRLGDFLNMKKYYSRELNALNEIKGENIARIIGEYSIVRNDEYVIVYEYFENGRLSNVLANENLSDRQRLEIALGIASGLARIHELGYCHRGIKPANIFLTSKYVAKIGDMALARTINPQNEDEDEMTVIPDYYLPREATNSSYDGKKSDIFSFGLTLVEIFGGKHKRRIVERNPRFFWPLIECCLSEKAQDRPDAKKIENIFMFFKNFLDKFETSLRLENYPRLNHNRDYFQRSYDYLSRQWDSRSLIFWPMLNTTSDIDNLAASRALKYERFRNENNNQNRNSSETAVCECTKCKKKIFAWDYIYKCVTCKDRSLCSYCFENRRHKSNQMLLRIDDLDEFVKLGFKIDAKLSINMLKEKYKNNQHACVKCFQCKTEPIKGLRFNFESNKEDLNLCFKCFNSKSAKPVSICVIITRANSKISEHFSPGLFNWLKERESGCLDKLEFKEKIYPYYISKNDNSTSYFNEIDAYDRIKGENILRIVASEVVNERESIFFHAKIVELVEKESLSKLLETENEKSLLSPKTEMLYRRRLDIAVGVASGLSRIHSLGFVHQNLNSDLVYMTPNYVPKIMLTGSCIRFDKQANKATEQRKKDMNNLGDVFKQLFGNRVMSIIVEKCCDTRQPDDSKQIEKALRFFQDLVIDVIDHKYQAEIYFMLPNRDKNSIFECVDRVVQLKMMERYNRIDLSRLLKLSGLMESISAELHRANREPPSPFRVDQSKKQCTIS